VTQFNDNGCWFQAILDNGDTATIISLGGLLRFLKIHNPDEDKDSLLDREAGRRRGQPQRILSDRA
jgi:hypothetical protein